MPLYENSQTLTFSGSRGFFIFRLSEIIFISSTIIVINIITLVSYMFLVVYLWYTNGIKDMNTTFNTIETIRTDATITDKASAYLNAMDSFEQQAVQYANNENFICRKSAEEISIIYNSAKSANCEYQLYTQANACEKWLEKAWNNA